MDFLFTNIEIEKEREKDRARINAWNKISDSKRIDKKKHQGHLSHFKGEHRVNGRAKQKGICFAFISKGWPQDYFR
jgi:hypothetical protein